MTTRIFGSGIRRREDPRLITGQAAFTDDIKLLGLVHAAILRSVHAHAKINSIDTSAARAAPGVLAVYTGADTDGVLNPIPCAWLPPDSDIKAVDHPPLAVHTVRYVGDAVAIVVAESRYQAEDALELITVDYRVLPSVINPKAAMDPGAPQLHEDAPNNQAFHWKVAGGDADAAFASAAGDPGNYVVVSESIIQQRLIPHAIDTRPAIANWQSVMGELTLWNTTKNHNIGRFLQSWVPVCGGHRDGSIA